MPAPRSLPLRRCRLASALVALALAASPLGVGPASAKNLKSGGAGGWSVELLSSAPDQVSGVDALVRVGFPGNAINPDAVLLLTART